MGRGDVSGIEIRFSGIGDDLCLGQRNVTGIVLGPDGRPVEASGWKHLIDGSRPGWMEPLNSLSLKPG